MTTHYIACSQQTTFDDVQYSKHHTVCPRKSSFVTKGLIKKGEMEDHVIWKRNIWSSKMLVEKAEQKKTTYETKIQTGEY